VADKWLAATMDCPSRWTATVERRTLRRNMELLSVIKLAFMINIELSKCKG